MILIAFNEELSIEKVVKDFLKQKNVEEVIVVDNHSSDDTVKIATRCGAKVIQKSENKGISDSIFLGFKKSLESDCNIIAITESDGTHNAYDLERMTKYLDNCDEVIGTRQIQVLCEKENQNGILHVWGNMFLAKLIQLKYFNLQYFGIIELSDIGCLYRCLRKEALEQIINEIENVTNKQKLNEKRSKFSPMGLLLTLTSIENNLKIIELPVTFKQRIGYSKSQADKKRNAILYGLRFLWLILSR
jgi:glycosyltransferase involved in cell wall biosynthesis